MGMKSSESDLPFFDCDPPGFPAGECLRVCRPFFAMTSPFFGFGLPGGRGAGGAVFCFFAGLTHVSNFTMSISRFRPCRVQTTMPAREPWARSQASMSKSGGASAPCGHSTREFVRNHLSSSSSSIAPFVQGGSFRFRAARKASARLASSALSAGADAGAESQSSAEMAAPLRLVRYRLTHPHICLYIDQLHLDDDAGAWHEVDADDDLAAARGRRAGGVAGAPHPRL